MRRSKLAIGIVLLTGLLLGCGDSEIIGVFDNSGYKMIIGTGGVEGVDEEKSRFRIEEEVTFELEGDKAIGSIVKVSILKINDEVETLLINQKIDIDPTWTWMTYQFGQFPETGEFTIRLFDEENVLLGERDLSILP